MLCPKCDAPCPEDARFCPLCGAKLEEERPQKRSRRTQEIRPPALPMRLLLVLCALILFCVTTADLVVRFIGQEAEATILSTSIRKQLDNETRLYAWDVTYEFYANGVKYIDTDELTGPEGSVNTFGYHVLYLRFAPQVSRLSRSSSVSALHPLSDAARTGGGAVLSFALHLLAAYFLLWVAFPRLPFFGIGKQKKKRRRK